MVHPPLRWLAPLVVTLVVGCSDASSAPITVDADPLAGALQLREVTALPAALQPGAVPDTVTQDPVRPILFVEGQRVELRQPK